VKGTLYLIPVTLGDDDYRKVLPDGVLELVRKLRHFIVEDLRSARRFLRLIDRQFPIDDSLFLELSEHTSDPEYAHYLDAIDSGNDMGILSEAGLPCIADPGSLIVAMAHRKGIKVVPLSGPSAIILALISSGLNGQNFTFNGYLPVKNQELVAKIKELEKNSSKGVTQIFMETPYRAQRMYETLVSSCQNETRLCIAENITLPSESIRTMTIGEWKNKKPDLDDRLVVFVLQ
jgi:16S rRNA (cytidine1402-2'-O)-methyltransferase